MKKRILSALLAVACAVSGLSLSALAAPAGQQDGLLATFYQMKGAMEGHGGVLGAIVTSATGYPYSADAGTMQYGKTENEAVTEENLLFDDSIDALLEATDVVGETEMGLLADITSMMGELNVTGNDALICGKGKLNVAEAGTYTFSGKVDNGVVIKIGDQKAFEFWGCGSWADGEYGVVSNTITLDAGEYDFEVYFLEYGGGELVQVNAEKDGQLLPFDDWFEIQEATLEGRGITGFTSSYSRIADVIPAGGGADSATVEGNQYYDDSIDAVKELVKKVGSTVLPNFDIVKEDFRGTAGWVGCNVNGEAEGIYVEYEGFVTPAVSGTYAFGASAVDNCLMIEIDGQRVFEYWASATWYDDALEIIYDGERSIALEAGKSYPIKVSYLELDGGEAVTAYVNRDGEEMLIEESGLSFSHVEKSSKVSLASVTVNGNKATIDEAKKTVTVKLPFDIFNENQSVANTSVQVTLKEGVSAVVSADKKKITATAADGTVVEYKLNITFQSMEEWINEALGDMFELLPESNKVVVGKKIEVIPLVSGKYANKKITWKSSSPKVAKVNQKGVVTGKKVGKATISATIDGKKVSVKITVQPKKLTIKKVSGKKGQATIKIKKVKGVKKYSLVIKNKKGKKVLTKTLKKATTVIKNKKLKKGKYTVEITYKKSGIKSAVATKKLTVKK